MNQWKFITREKKADIEVLDMPLLNTKTEISGLTGVFITDMVLQILAYVAETERSFIRKRQAEGIAAAKSRGVHFGCKKIELDKDDLIVFEQWTRGEINAEQASRMLKISESTFYRRAREKKCQIVDFVTGKGYNKKGALKYYLGLLKILFFVVSQSLLCGRKERSTHGIS